MRVVTRVYLYDDDQKVFGEGPYRLLCKIHETGSLKAACESMNLSYSKGSRMISQLQKSLPFTLTKKKIGGIGGGGSELTQEAIDFIEQYKAFKEACDESNHRLYSQFFQEL